MSILVVGSVAFDDLQTPTKVGKDVLGGAATYFALSASFFTDVNVVAVVGDDFTDTERSVFEGRSIDLAGLVTSKGKTFRWGGKYSDDLSKRETLYTELGVFETFRPDIPRHFEQSSLVFLANIHPSLQLSVMEQIREPLLIGADTMNYWIERTPAELRTMLEGIDLLVINDEEARQLGDEHNLVKAAAKIRAMGPGTVVVKRGEHGVLCFREEERFATVSYPLETVVDPTGAGDSFAGGLMGYLATHTELTDRVVRQAIIFGSVLGSFSVEDLGTARLQRLTREEVYERYQAFKELTDFAPV
ncbi:MAG TPA: PfkB family carbohydrate kinase [Vicinamibacteria bacterium]|nr:PfkB family carbohydrate kinase [Vicinamibacteria bacterium]